MISEIHKNLVLSDLADLIQENTEAIISANQIDVAAYRGDDISMMDRLITDHKKISGMVKSVKVAIALNSPEGKVLYRHEPENGLKIENRSVPFGNILIIYESRPDVTIEAAITAFKAGNKILLKGGKEAKNSNLLLVDLWHKALAKNDVSTSYVTYLDIDRTATQKLIRENTHQVDLIIPRGGEGLINFVKSNTDIPVIVSGRGNNFLFVDKDCDFEMAVQIILDGKSRVSVCNALDKVILHQDIAKDAEKLMQLIVALKKKGIVIILDENINYSDPEITTNSDPEVYYEEFLSAKILISVSEDLQQAIRTINKYSGGHSATIVTNNQSNAQQFMEQVDCAAVYHNASTRFTDGGQFGFGAEMAISTQKLHFRGPVAIDQLVTNKWFVFGTGQIRK